MKLNVQLFSVRGTRQMFLHYSLLGDGLKPCSREGFYWTFQGDEHATDFVTWRVINMIATLMFFRPCIIV